MWLNYPKLSSPGRGDGKTPGCSRITYLFNDLRDILGSSAPSTTPAGIGGLRLSNVALNSVPIDSFRWIIDEHVTFCIMDVIEPWLLSSRSRGRLRLNWMALPLSLRLTILFKWFLLKWYLLASDAALSVLLMIKSTIHNFCSCVAATWRKSISAAISGRSGRIASAMMTSSSVWM